MVYDGIPVHLPSLRVHQNLTYEPQAEQELCVYQDTLVSPGITFTIVHHFTRSSMHSSTHFIPKHIVERKGKERKGKGYIQYTYQYCAHYLLTYFYLDPATHYFLFPSIM